MVTSNSRLGQIRIIEAVVVALLIFIISTTVFFMLFSSEKFFKQEVVDLNRLAYNVLNRLIESGVIEESIGDGRVDEAKIANVLRNLLPQGIYFNLTIGQQRRLGYWEKISSISNAPQSLFEVATEVASASVIYTSKDGRIYYLALSLSRIGLTSTSLKWEKYMV